MLAAVLSSPPNTAAAACPNEALRGGLSARLPDCRGYELASPSLGPVSMPLIAGRATAEGSGVAFVVLDPPEGAEASGLNNLVASRRGSGGWVTEPLTSPLTQPSSGFLRYQVAAVSSDLSQFLAYSEQPLAGPGSPSGMNLYLRRPDGTYVALTTVGDTLLPELSWAATGFTHVYFRTCPPQLPVDPAVGCSAQTYDWHAGELSLLGILPDGRPAPEGARLAHSTVPPASSDGASALFVAEGPEEDGLPSHLYLRRRGSPTVAVSISQRSVEPDPNPRPAPGPVGIAADGSEALFTSRAELTDDAYTGRGGGVASDAGADLYSYDVGTARLTDLTVDRKPADAATGADVTGVLGAAADLSYVYFEARGDLAPGATSGASNLYVEHEGAIEFVASDVHPEAFYVTPDGRHAAVLSRQTLTGYGNVNPVTNEAEAQLFVYAYGGGIDCASCRPDGTLPEGGASLPAAEPFFTPAPPVRVLSDDGARAFFQSTDAVIPSASNGLQNVFEYEDGGVHLISPGDGEHPATLLDASASGGDVFFVERDELAPDGLGPLARVYDARVGGGSAAPPAVDECAGEACLGAASEPPNLARPVLPAHASTRLRVARRLRIRGARGRLEVEAPGPGSLTLSGRGLRPARKRVGTGEPAVIALRLTKSARKRLSLGLFATRAQVRFLPRSGISLRATVALRFRAAGRGTLR